MIDVIRQAGPFGYLIGALFLVNGGLAGLILIRLLGAGERAGPALRSRINTILFWGVMGAVAGLLGQASGIYRALMVVARAPEISPPVVIQGFAISFITTILGLVLLLVSALVWLGLRSMHGRRMGGGATA